MTTSISSKELKKPGKKNRQNELKKRSVVDKCVTFCRNQETFLKYERQIEGQSKLYTCFSLTQGISPKKL